MSTHGSHEASAPAVTRVYLLTDVEGVAGVEAWDPRAYGAPHADRLWAEMSELLVGEVRAAVDGALAAGAREILVRDGHGRGESLPTSGWPEEVRLVRGVEEGGSWLPELDTAVDALLFVGQHAMEGAARSVLAHSWSAKRPRRCFLDGVEVGEIGAAVRLAASFGVPTAFLSGDRAACEEARELIPAVHVAEVKRKDDDGRVRHLAPSDARELIRTSVREALKDLPTPPEPVQSDAHTFREVFLRPPYHGLPFLAARLLGRPVARALLKRGGRWPTDPEVHVRVPDRRTLEYRGPSIPAVLACPLGG